MPLTVPWNASRFFGIAGYGKPKMAMVLRWPSLISTDRIGLTVRKWGSDWSKPRAARHSLYCRAFRSALRASGERTPDKKMVQMFSECSDCSSSS